VIAVKAASQTCHYLRNEKLETLPVSKKSWKMRSRRRGGLDKISDEQLGELVLKSQLNSKDRKSAMHVLSKKCRLKSKDKRRRLTAILSRPVAQQLIERSTVIHLIEKHLSIDWSEYVKKKEPPAPLPLHTASAEEKIIGPRSLNQGSGWEDLNKYTGGAKGTLSESFYQLAKKTQEGDEFDLMLSTSVDEREAL